MVLIYYRYLQITLCAFVAIVVLMSSGIQTTQAHSPRPTQLLARSYWATEIVSIRADSACPRYLIDGKTSLGRWTTITRQRLGNLTEPRQTSVKGISLDWNAAGQSEFLLFRGKSVAGHTVLRSIPPLSNSDSYTMYLPLAANNYTHPLFNGDFEIIADDSAMYWEREGVLSVSITTTLSNGDFCYSGTYCALLGSSGYPCNRVPLGYGRVCQTFGVPFTGTPTLSFWYRIFSYDEYGKDRYDSFDVYIDDIFDEAPRILLWRDGSTDGKYGCEEEKLDITDWKFHESDLSAISDGSGGTVDYRGKTVQLCFSVHSRETDPKRAWGWYNTWAYLDGVHIRQD
jgi:hypothetical protein